MPKKTITTNETTHKICAEFQISPSSIFNTEMCFVFLEDINMCVLPLPLFRQFVIVEETIAE